MDKALEKEMEAKGYRLLLIDEGAQWIAKFAKPGERGIPCAAGKNREEAISKAAEQQKLADNR